MPQADIADYLGMTVETVNRTMARLVRDAIIGVGKHGIDLLDPKRLREIAETAIRASSARDNYPSEEKMLKIKKLEHVLLGKVGQLFRNML